VASDKQDGKIDLVIDEITAALQNIRHERAEAKRRGRDGDKAALLYFIVILGDATGRLANLIEGHAASLDEAAISKFEAARATSIMLRFKTIEAEMKTLGAELETALQRGSGK